MRKLIYLLLPLSFLVGCASGDVPPGPEPDPDPPGPTPVYIETPSKIVTSNADGTVLESYFQYNESGYKTRIETKRRDASEAITDHFIETLTYDDHNELVKDIRYDEHTKTNETDLTYTYEYDDKTITLKNPIKEGYKFVGWYDSYTKPTKTNPNEVWGNEVASITEEDSKNYTLYVILLLHLYRKNRGLQP